MTLKPEDVKIVFALDVSTFGEAQTILDEVAEFVDVIKVGHQFLSHVGNVNAIKFVQSHPKSKEVFVDCKMIDIPNSMKGGAGGLPQWRMDYFNVMASAGVKAMQEVVEINKEKAELLSVPRPKIIAVTVLTSLGFSDLIRQGYRPDFFTFKQGFGRGSEYEIASAYAILNRYPWDKYEVKVDRMFSDAKAFKAEFISRVVMNLSEMAVEAGVDILLSSPIESPKMHAKWPEIPLYSPGIRLPDAPPDDQQRTMTPGEAVRNGVQYLVIGRPISQPSGGRTRQETIELIKADIAHSLSEKGKGV
jgi:orotidine-5'-phosphate decarboxylase